MRLILRLEAIKDQSYDNNYNHNVQSFFYNLIKDTEFHHLHDFKGTTSPTKRIIPFCFSNIFPYGYMKQGQLKNIIISSPDKNFIFLLYDRTKNLKRFIHFGDLQFHIIGLKTFDLKITSQIAKFITTTPIIVRIPQSAYQNYDLELKYPYRYIFWRQTYPLELFLNQLEINIKKKFVNYYNRDPESLLKFTKFVFRKQISQRLLIRGMVQTIIATFWEFWFDDVNELTRFGLDAGFGERNSLGFGFMNLT